MKDNWRVPSVPQLVETQYCKKEIRYLVEELNYRINDPSHHENLGFYERIL